MRQGVIIALDDVTRMTGGVVDVLPAIGALRKGNRGNAKQITFGCGGDRDPHKRPLMGAAAAAHADQIVLTNDNPRSESPETILAQIRAGVPLARTEPDRALAIALALTQADARDVVLVAGKGHEDYQEMAGVRTPFSDREQVALALRARRTGVRV